MVCNLYPEISCCNNSENDYIWRLENESVSANNFKWLCLKPIYSQIQIFRSISPEVLKYFIVMFRIYQRNKSKLNKGGKWERYKLMNEKIVCHKFYIILLKDLNLIHGRVQTCYGTFIEISIYRLVFWNILLNKFYTVCNKTDHLWNNSCKKDLNFINKT